MHIEQVSTREWKEGGRVHGLAEQCRVEWGVPCWGGRRERMRSDGRGFLAIDGDGTVLAAAESSSDRWIGLVARADLDTELLAQCFRELMAASAARVAESRTDDSLSLPLVMSVSGWTKVTPVSAWFVRGGPVVPGPARADRAWREILAAGDERFWLDDAQGFTAKYFAARLQRTPEAVPAATATCVTEHWFCEVPLLACTPVLVQELEAAGFRERARVLEAGPP